MGKKIEVKQGDRYGRLTIIKEVEHSIEPSGRKVRMFMCQCDCGNQKKFRLNDIRSGNTKSCGCYNSELTINRNKITGKIYGKLIGGHNKTHGVSNHPLYGTWVAIKHRCYNPKSEKYPIYGGRGIKMFELWINDPKSFITWILENLGEKPGPEYSIDRIDTEFGNYEPGSIRWATPEQQANNKRKKG
jgi:hypothetical protein